MTASTTIRLFSLAALATTVLIASGAHADDTLGPCNLSRGVLKATDLSLLNAQNMKDHPEQYTYMPWCDPLKGVFLSLDLDADGNGIIDALEPVATPTPGAEATPDQTPAPVNATSTPKTKKSTPKPTVTPTATISPAATPTQAGAVLAVKATPTPQVRVRSDDRTGETPWLALASVVGFVALAVGGGWLWQSKSGN